MVVKRLIPIHLLICVVVVLLVAGCASDKPILPMATTVWPQPPTPTVGPNVPRQPSFSWDVVPGASSYEVQLSRDTTFLDSLTTTKLTPINSIIWNSDLQFSRIYYWRFRVLTSSGPLTWSGPKLYTTELNPLSDEGRAPS